MSFAASRTIAIFSVQLAHRDERVLQYSLRLGYKPAIRKHDQTQQPARLTECAIWLLYLKTSVSKNSVRTGTEEHEQMFGSVRSIRCALQEVARQVDEDHQGRFHKLQAELLPLLVLSALHSGGMWLAQIHV
jgi:hypothetical protein